MFALAISIVCLLLGVSVLRYARKEISYAWQSRKWPQVTGHIARKVTLEGVTQGMTTDGTLAPAEQAFRVTTPVYSYSVGGQTYESARVNCSGDRWDSLDHFFEIGEEVPVYYYPTEPSYSVLKPGGIPLSLIAGCTFMIIGALSLAFVIFVWP